MNDVYIHLQPAKPRKVQRRHYSYFQQLQKRAYAAILQLRLVRWDLERRVSVELQAGRSKLVSSMYYCIHGAVKRDVDSRDTTDSGQTSPW